MIEPEIEGTTSIRIAAKPVPSRIVLLPVGDSITLGIGSTDGNGYRRELAKLIKGGGRRVKFIGTQADGDDHSDNRHEGYGGNRVSQIQSQLEDNGILRQQPDLILIHIGTNDNWFTIDGETYADAPARLGNFLDYVIRQNSQAIVLVAMLVQNKQNQEQTDYYNSHVSDLVDQRRSQGYKIRVVDHSVIGGSELSDLLHPDDVGYAHMARIWYAAILNIPDNWWISSEHGTQLTSEES